MIGKVLLDNFKTFKHLEIDLYNNKTSKSVKKMMMIYVENGIGKYLGVETLEFNGQRKDFLHIQYGGEDKLYIPVDQVHCLQKYISDNDTPPKLSRLVLYSTSTL